jgi:malonyl-CoA/methylmalonyl-CoA synthetase
MTAVAADRMAHILHSPATMTTNLFDRVRSRNASTVGAPCIETEDGRTLSYEELFALTARYGAAFRKLGVRKGDRVAVQIEKSAEAFCLYLAVLRIGAVYIPMNVAYLAPEIQHIFRDAAPRVYVVDPLMRNVAGALARECGVKHVVTMDQWGNGTLSLLAIKEADSIEPIPLDSEEIAAIVYTSGTTGLPKGAMLTHGNLILNAEALVRLWGFTEADVLLHALPIFHAHGLFISSHCALLSGSRMLFVKKFSADRIVKLLPRAPVLMGVPTFYARLLDHKDLSTTVTRSIRLFISGSAPLSAETMRVFRHKTGHQILERYGMTESLVITALSCSDERRTGTVGRPIDGMELRVVDEAQSSLPLGTVGEIQIRGTSLMKGYWRKTDQKSAEFTSDGWFRTGDLGTVDCEGYLSIMGRGKDLVISGGLNVYPKEVELAIDTLPGIQESAVIGVPHADLGEAVTAVIVRDDARLTRSDVLDALKLRLAGYKVPKFIHFVDALPRNAMGKVLKAQLRVSFASAGAIEEQRR